MHRKAIKIRLLTTASRASIDPRLKGDSWDGWGGVTCLRRAKLLLTGALAPTVKYCC